MAIEFENELRDRLKKRLPHFQRGNESLDQFLEVAGGFFDSLREAIEQMKYGKEPENATIQQLNDYADEVKINFPSDVREEALKVAVRDIVTIYRFKGTEKTLNWIFDIIGLGVSIKYAWVQNPDTFDPPDPRDVNRDVFWFGTEKVRSNGTYFYGEDNFGNTHNKIPILGESYPANKKKSSDVVMKTPYIFLEVNSSDYVTFTNQFDTDDETLLDNVIKNYFDEIRPANVALVVVITEPDQTDEITYSAQDDFTRDNITEPVHVDASWAVGYASNPYQFYEFYDQIKLAQDKVYIPYREEFQRLNNVYAERNITTADFDDDIHLRSSVLYEIFGTINAGSLTVQVTESSRPAISRGEHVWQNLSTFTSNMDLHGGLAGYTKGRVTTSSDFDGSVTIKMLQTTPLIPTSFQYLLGVEHQRNTTANTVNEQGELQLIANEEVRFYYNPRNSSGQQGDLLGYVIEPSATNFIRWSDRLDETVWNPVNDGAVDLSSVTAPNPAASMYSVFRDSGNDGKAGLRQSVSVNSTSTQHTFSVFAKRRDRKYLAFNVETDGNRSLVVLNTETGAITETQEAGSLTNTEVYYQRFKNDVYRLFFQFNTASSTNVDVTLIADHNGSFNENGTYFWGAQLEEGTGTTYYSSNNDVQTRAADDIGIDTIPSGLINLNLDEELLTFLDFSVFSTTEELSVINFVDENVNNIQLKTIPTGFRLSSNLFTDIDVTATLNNTNRSDVIHHYVMIGMKNVGSGNYEYSFYYNDTLVGTRTATAFQGVVSGSLGSQQEGVDTFNGTAYDLYFAPLSKHQLIEDKYSELLKAYREYNERNL